MKSKELILDSLDKDIIRNFFLPSNQGKTFTEMIKVILKIKKVGNKEYNLIYNRIKKMSCQKLFNIVRNSYTKFYINSDFCFKQKFSFPTRRREGIAVLINGKYEIFEL